MKPNEDLRISNLDAWIMASRPRTLPAAVAPVVVGSAMALADESFVWLPAVAALLVALLLQVGVNLANDYFDYLKGIDTHERLGPARVTQSGLIPPNQVKAAMILTIILSAIPGTYLLIRGGWPVIIIGCACVVALLAYSGGHYPLASHGLGDLFVFIFFGLVAVCGTYYVQVLHLTPIVWWMGVIEGLLITAILVVNNLRDIQTDRRTGKHTLAVTIGDRGCRIEYVALLAVAYAIPIAFWLSERMSAWVILPLLTLPLAISLMRLIWKSPADPILNQALVRTVRLALLFSMLLSIGLNI
jgi:1,4-dihydroxy-2-naphthoate octaprenyltransferase